MSKATDTFDLACDWVCTIEHKAGEATVTVKKASVSATPQDTGITTTYTIGVLRDPSGIQRGIVLDK